MKNQTQSQELFSVACEYHQQGLLEKAEQTYRRVLEIDENHIDSLRNLGAMLRQLGRPLEGIQYQEKALKIEPNNSGLLGNMGNVLRDLKRHEESEKCFTRAIEIDEQNIGLKLGLVITLNAQGKHREVIQLLENNISKEINREDEKTWSQLMLELGNAYHQMGNKGAAISKWSESQSMAEGENKIAMTLNMAQVLCDSGKYSDAEKLLKPQVEAHTNHPNIIYAYGVTLRGLGNWEEAVNFFERALEIKPNYSLCLNTYGLLLRDMGKIHQSRHCFEKALLYDSEFGAAMNNLGSVLKDVARYKEALRWLRKGAENMERNAAAHSNVLFTLVGYELESVDEMYAEAVKYGDKFGLMYYERWKDRIILPDKDKELKVGFISPDFCRHAVSYFIEPLLEKWKNHSINITLYACGSVRDDYSERLKTKADRWRDLQGVNDELAIQQIIQDEIDILVDLAGHTAGNKLTILSQKPAPIQATYLGYYGTTGLKQVDYWITDRTLHPDRLDSANPSTEEKCKLNRSYVSYKPIKNAPEIAELPLINRKVPMLGSFNQSRKITDKTAENWMEVLNEVKDAHLFLKSKNLGEKEEQIRIRELFEGLGLAADRLHLEGHSPSVEYHLDRYQNIDIALDTFPYTGCTTTADALWMGVPVLTVSGNTMVSRQASAVLKAAGHPEWICEDKYDLTAKVKKILSDPQKLSKQRKRMREELKNSELLNYEELATDLKDTFKEWWGSFLTKNNVISRSNPTGKSWEISEHNKESRMPTFSPLKHR